MNERNAFGKGVGERHEGCKYHLHVKQNGRRHLTSSRNKVSRDLIVHTNSTRKQALLDIPVLTELHHAQDTQVALETHVNEGNFFKWLCI